jgi:amidohydrolase
MAEIKENLPGTLKFIFQPAEEGPPPGEQGGADMMVDEGVMQAPRPEAVFGLHTFAQMEVGKVGYTVGPAFAAVDHFVVELKGKQSHGAAPHLGIDPVVMAAQAVMALQTIRSRTLSPLEPSVVTVGIVRGGTRYNIIPDMVLLEGTVRTYDAKVRDTVERRMHEILAGISSAAGGTYSMDYQRGTPPTINDPELTRRVAPLLEQTVGADNVSVIDPTMGGEDFAYFANEVPGFYFRLGMVKPGTRSGGHHTVDFLADDSSVPVGMRVMANLLLGYLQQATR